MLRLRRIEIDNFALFDRLVLEPSTDSEQPLTVIRAENGSGKTTFLRAVLWGMYGEQGLPGDRTSHYSVHPAWWVPDTEGIETEVAIEFETDGSTRHHQEGGVKTSVYRLSRTVRTVGKPASGRDEPDFRRVDEKTSLMERQGDGVWLPHSAGVDTVVGQLLPWELRDFFVMDADEATDFVGGTESKVVRRDVVEKKTTDAVRSLLGIEVFEGATVRLRRIARKLGREATAAVGDRDLNMLQAEQDDLERQKESLEETLRQERERRADLTERLEGCREQLEAELMRVGAFDALVEASRRAKLQKAAAAERQRSGLALLSSALESTDLLAPLLAGPLRKVCGGLRPLYDSGAIPLRHVAYVRQLLRDGTCVCGQDLVADGGRRQKVEEQLEQAAAQEKEASYLSELYEVASAMLMRAENSEWVARQRGQAAEVALAERELQEAALEDQDTKKKIDRIDREKVRVLRDELAAIESRLDDLKRVIGRHEDLHTEAANALSSVQKTVAQRQRNEVAAADSRDAEDLAELAVEILSESYQAIQDQQVADLSSRMNHLFGQMAASVTEDDFDAGEAAKASLRMIDEVGIRPVEGRPDRYEIYALNGRGRAMPPTEINGASRRVLALSFILALCAESRTHAPLIADSLLNSMSGAVRRNTLRVTVRNSDQPILLLTGADLESPAEVESVRTYGGAAYTLTGQWDALEAGKGGDVVNWTESKNVALLCRCGPREYCAICERTGQAGSPGWVARLGKRGDGRR